MGFTERTYPTHLLVHAMFPCTCMYNNYNYVYTCLARAIAHAFSAVAHEAGVEFDFALARFVSDFHQHATPFTI